jgi:hypothetical protein
MNTSLRSLGLLLLALTLTVGSVTAAEITIVPNTVNNFRDTRGLNDVGIGQGDRNQFGASIMPSLGSTLTGVQGITVGPATCAPLAVSPNFCATAPPFNSSRLGSWNLTFTNGPDSATISTPTLAGAENPVPFPQSVTISGSGLTPTFTFTIPAGFSADAIRITIFDKTVTLPNGQKDVVHSQALSASTTSFTVPTTLSSGQPLHEGRSYVLGIQLIDLRPGVTEAQFLASNNNAMILRRSNSFFDFTSLGGGAPPQVILPTVGPDTNPNDNLGAVYQFQVAGITTGQIIFIDPFVAIGYDYTIGAGDPNFASVILPNVGDGSFDLTFGNTTTTIQADTQFFFPPGGVSEFSVRGIETSANLDPNNVTAFITGLTFVGSGEFTGTMTPVLQSVGVPEPSVLLLLGSGLAWLASTAASRRRRKSASRRRWQRAS